MVLVLTFRFVPGYFLSKKGPAMSLTPGTKLGSYEILSALGAGGMGEVYRARDPKLERDIAIKVLPAEVTENDERLGRFEREAKALAALDHPNIVAVHSIEEDQGTPFITMQLVMGRNLSELIAHKGLPLKQFFEIAIPLADAVSSAHEQGITHRDLKPDNLMVSDKGQLKILDFGLAKLRPEAGEASDSALPTAAMTEAGRIVGTAAYMSPEQAEGKRIDHRSDMFSMGTILYEMLTGQRPFKGEGQASILSSILRDTPPSVTTLNSDCPRELSRIVKRCLVKDPDDRYQSAKDLRNELKEIKQELDSGDLLEPARVAAPIRSSRTLLAGVGVVAVVAALIGYFLRPGDSASTGDAGQSVAGTFSQLTSHPAREWFPTLSPDGKWVVYASDRSGNWDIYLQSVGGERAINLTQGVEDDDTQPAFSPDGEQIVFRSERDGGGLFVMGRTGESVKRVADFGHNPSWAPDGKRIVCATGATVNTRGRAPSKLWVLDITSGEKNILSDSDAAQPHWSPQGHRIAFWSLLGGAEIWTMPANGGEPVRVTEDGHFDWNPVWSPDGAYVYFSSDRGGSQNLWRVALSEESGKVLGSPEPVTSGVASDAVHLSLSGDGRKVAYVAQVVASNIHKMDFDPSSGKVQGQYVPVTEGSKNIASVRPSPDGEWLAYTTSGKQEDLFLIRTDGSDRRQLTNDRAKDRVANWSPDGKRIAFYSNRTGTHEIWTIHPDGSGMRQLTKTPEDPNRPVWSPDGSQIAYTLFPQVQPYIFRVDTDWSEQKPQPLPPLDDSDEKLFVTSWSADGRRLTGHRVLSGKFGRGVIIYDFESQRYERLSDVGRPCSWVADTDSLLARTEHTIELIDSRTKERRELLSVKPHRFEHCSITPDGRTIYFVIETTEADIWLLTLDDET